MPNRSIWRCIDCGVLFHWDRGAFTGYVSLEEATAHVLRGHPFVLGTCHRCSVKLFPQRKNCARVRIHA